MTVVANQTFANTVVHMDGKRFEGCKFSHCTFRYAGGECEWDEHTVFDTASTWKFEECALRTVEILQSIGWLSTSGSFGGRRR